MNLTTGPAGPESSPVGRLLARLDRLPGLGGGRTHFVFLLLFFAGSLSLYLMVLKLRGPAAAYKTWIEWDRFFPFTPWWTWLYLLPYLAGPLLVMVLRRPAFVWYVQRAVLVVAASLAVFVVLPTQTVRPLAEDNPLREVNEARLGDGWTARLYRQMVAIDDPPANAAPSLHVSLSCLLAWGLGYDRPRWWWAALMGAILVSLSTLYTAQHHLIDVGSGALLASLAAIGSPRRLNSP